MQCFNGPGKENISKAHNTLDSSCNKSYDLIVNDWNQVSQVLRT